MEQITYHLLLLLLLLVGNGTNFAFFIVHKAPYFRNILTLEIYYYNRISTVNANYRVIMIYGK